jgi:hypothetical protein
MDLKRFRKILALLLILQLFLHAGFPHAHTHLHKDNDHCCSISHPLSFSSASFSVQHHHPDHNLCSKEQDRLIQSKNFLSWAVTPFQNTIHYTFRLIRAINTEYAPTTRGLSRYINLLRAPPSF